MRGREEEEAEFLDEPSLEAAANVSKRKWEQLVMKWKGRRKDLMDPPPGLPPPGLGQGPSPGTQDCGFFV